MPDPKEKESLIELLRHIPNLPQEFIEKISRKLSESDDEQFEKIKAIIVAAAEKLDMARKTYVKSINALEKEKIIPLFENMELQSIKEDEKHVENILSNLA